MVMDNKSERIKLIRSCTGMEGGVSFIIPYIPAPPYK